MKLYKQKNTLTILLIVCTNLLVVNSSFAQIEGGLSMIPPVEPSKIILVEYMAHLQGMRDVRWRLQPEVCGTGAQRRRLEGFSIRFAKKQEDLGIQYMAHVQGIGDQGWINEEGFIGTKNKGRRLEGFAIQLYGQKASRYDIYYMAHLHEKGNTRWYKNGEFCGTRGQGIPVQAISVFIAEKGAQLRNSWSPVFTINGVNDYYPNCFNLLDVNGFVYSRFDYRINVDNTTLRANSDTDLYLYLVAAVVRDNGENQIRDPADIGLHVMGGASFTEEITQTKLYGQIYSGDESNGEHKYEWKDYCTMKYNNFVIMNLSKYSSKGIKIFAREGDHGLTGNDIVFSAYINLKEIQTGKEYLYKVEGNCDIPGDCATLYFAIRPWGYGKFW
jgi:uncharacterized protein YjdB